MAKEELEDCRSLPVTYVEPSLEFFAGLFDADGTIGLRSTGQIHINLHTQHELVCLEMHRYFAERGLVCNILLLDKQKAKYRFHMSGKESCFEFLRIVVPFLRRKKKQAELILQSRASLDLCNFHDNSWLRDELRFFKGRHRGYILLDENGYTRAQEAHRLMNKCWYRETRNQDSSETREKLEQLRAHHWTECHTSAAQRLRTNIRDLLDGGATQTKPRRKLT